LKVIFRLHSRQQSWITHPTQSLAGSSFCQNPTLVPRREFFYPTSVSIPRWCMVDCPECMKLSVSCISNFPIVETRQLDASWESASLREIVPQALPCGTHLRHVLGYVHRYWLILTKFIFLRAVEVDSGKTLCSPQYLPKSNPERNPSHHRRT